MIIDSLQCVTLLGGGEATSADLSVALNYAPCLVAADGGAALAVAQGAKLSAVIGDMDSLLPDIRARLPTGIVHRIDEQDTTDFDKALRNIVAPAVIGVGFLGGRVDHELAVLNTLIRRPSPMCILLGARDVIFAAPPAIQLDLPAGTRVSLFPLRRVSGYSTGLRWPISGLEFEPGGLIGTSNSANGPVGLEFDQPGMLVILPKAFLPCVLDALGHGRCAVQ
jgi:thiamine pyrophosphokinase